MAEMDENPYKAPAPDQVDLEPKTRERIPRDAIVNAILASFWLWPLIAILAMAAFRAIWPSG